MGATVTRNGKEYYKADDGKLYQNYDAAVKALGPKPAAPATNNTKKNAANAVAQQGQKQGPQSWLSNFNPVEAVANIALNNPVAAGFRSGMRMVGDALGHGEKMDAMDNAVRAVTGNRQAKAPTQYTGAGRTAVADGIDGAYAAGMKPNADGYVAVDYPHYNSTADGLIAGRIMGRKNSDGTYEIAASQGSNNMNKAAVEVEIADGAVVPEFGTIASLVLVVAISSIVVLSAKGRLSFTPRI